MKKLIRIFRKKKLMPNEVVLLRSDANYTHLYLENGKKLTVARTLKAMEIPFSQEGFIRTHKSYLINPNFITKYSSETNELVLAGKYPVLVSRRRKSAFEKTLF